MNLFTYGSLMFPAVWNRVAGEAFASAPAVLEGFEARKVRGQSYPVLVGAPGGRTRGVVYFDLTPEAVARLDRFEGDFYRRVPVTLKLERGGEIPAEVYAAAREDHPDVSPELWSAEEFERTHLESFLREDPGFREEPGGPRWNV